MGRPRKPNALSNAEKCKRYRASQTPEMIFKRKENDRLRKMKYRQNLKKEENKKAYEALKQRDNERKHKARENAPPPGTPFNNNEVKWPRAPIEVKWVQVILPVPRRHHGPSRRAFQC